MQNTINTEKTDRKGRDSYSHAKADRRKEKRRDEAILRQIKYDALSTEEKLASCIPNGSKRQRERLKKQLADGKAPTEAQRSEKTVKRSKASVKHSTKS